MKKKCAAALAVLLGAASVAWAASSCWKYEIVVCHAEGMATRVITPGNYCAGDTKIGDDGFGFMGMAAFTSMPDSGWAWLLSDVSQQPCIWLFKYYCDGQQRSMVCDKPWYKTLPDPAAPRCM